MKAPVGTGSPDLAQAPTGNSSLFGTVPEIGGMRQLSLELSQTDSGASADLSEY
jgi:hypothetical protein